MCKAEAAERSLVFDQTNGYHWSGGEEMSELLSLNKCQIVFSQSCSLESGIHRVFIWLWAVWGLFASSIS